MKYLNYMAAASMLALCACSSGSVKETLGLNRAAPDEFRVVSRPPLSVPPQFGLRPPSSGEVGINQIPADKKAQSLISGESADGAAADTAVQPVKSSTLSKKKKTSASAATTSADSQFLRNAGADKADPKVRDELVEEKISAQEKKENSSWWNIMSTGPDKKDPTVDARKESERLRKNSDEGKPVNEGTTPEVKPADHGILGSILGD